MTTQELYARLQRAMPNASDAELFVLLAALADELMRRDTDTGNYCRRALAAFKPR